MDYLIEEWDLDANGLMENYSFKSPSEAYWICRFNPEHRWKAIISNRTTGNGCRQCRVSKFEIDLREFIEELVGNSAVRNDRIILQGKELDIYFPDLAIAVEANGDYWHSNAVIYNQKGITSYKYHLDKLNKAALKGVRLIFVWESDWYENANAVRKAIQLFLQDPSDIDPLLSILSKEKS